MWNPFKIPLLWLIQQWSPIVFFCNLRCHAVQRHKSQTHNSLIIAHNRPFQMRAWSCITSYPLRGLPYLAYDSVNPAMVNSIMLRSSMHAFIKDYVHLLIEIIALQLSLILTCGRVISSDCSGGAGKARFNVATPTYEARTRPLHVQHTYYRIIFKQNPFNIIFKWGARLHLDGFSVKIIFHII